MKDYLPKNRYRINSYCVKEKKILSVLLLMILGSCAHSDQDRFALPIKSKKLKIGVNFNRMKEKKFLLTTIKLKKKTFNGKLSFKGNHVNIKLKGKSAILGKKSFRIRSIKSKKEYEMGLNEICLQNFMKFHGLIGFDSEFINVQFIDSFLPFFYQESIDKRLIESNQRRNGHLFSITKDVVKLEYNNSEVKHTTVQETIQDIINGVIANEIAICKAFDLDKCAKVLAILDYLNMDNLLKEHNLAYYLNPATGRIEIMVSNFNKFDNREEGINVENPMIHRLLQNKPFNYSYKQKLKLLINKKSIEVWARDHDILLANISPLKSQVLVPKQETKVHCSGTFKNNY